MPLILLPQNWATGDVIPSGWANNIGANFANVDSRTGGDPGLPDFFLASQVGGLTGVWRYLRQADFRTATIPDSAMINQKVNQVSPQLPSYAAALSSGFFDIANPSDGPIAGNLDWHLFQAKYPYAGDYRLQITCLNYDPGALYVRLVYNGTPTPWQKIWHAGNDGTNSGLDADRVRGYVPLDSAGGTVTGNLGVQGYVSVGNGISTYNRTPIASDAYVSARDNVGAGTGLSTTRGDITTGDGNIGTAKGGIYTSQGGISATGDINTSLGSIHADGGLVRGYTVEALGILKGPELTLNGSTGGYSLRADNGAIRSNSFVVNAGGGGVQVNGGGLSVSEGDVNVNPGTVRVKGFEVYHPGNLPPGGGGSGGETIPSGVIVAYEGTSQPTNWTFVSSTYQGRFLMVAGAGQHNTSGGAQSHGHTANLQHAHGSAALGVGGSIQGPTATNGLASPGGTNLPTETHGHNHNLDVNGSTDNALGTAQAIPGTDHLPPYRAINHIRRN